MADSIQFLSENRLNEFKFLDGSVRLLKTESEQNFVFRSSLVRRLPDRENCVIVRAFVFTGYWHVTDGRTDGRTDGHTAPPMPKSRSSVVERDKTHIHQSFWSGSQWVTSPAPWRTWPFRIWQAWLIHNTIQNKQVYRRRYESRRSSKPKLH